MGPKPRPKDFDINDPWTCLDHDKKLDADGACEVCGFAWFGEVTGPCPYHDAEIDAEYKCRICGTEWVANLINEPFNPFKRFM